MGKSSTTLALKYPALAQEWHLTLNGITTPDAVAPSGRFRAWWECPKCRNAYDATVNNRARGKGCPFCSGQRVDPKRNLATEHPALVSEWHPKNNTKPSEYSPSSHAKVWWKCEEGHEWEAVVNNRTSNGTTCPYCSGRLPTETKSLGFLTPDLVKEWHPTKNKITPYDVTQFSHKKAWWICEKKHEWESTVANRTNVGSGCPYCAGNLPTSENNLTVTHPLVSQQWHQTKNEELIPRNFSYGSGSKVWWICPKGHEWEAFINNRTNKDSGCPHCLKSGSSQQELLIWSELSHVYGNDNVSHRCRKYGFELDVFIKPLKVGIEYDGYYWHKSENKKLLDARKYSEAKEKGVILIRISMIEDSPPADHLIKEQKITKKVMNEIVNYLKTYDSGDYLDTYLEAPDLLSIMQGLR